MKKVIYVSGPYIADSNWGIESNVRRAEQMALNIAKMGGAPLCVHTQCRFFKGELPESEWLDISMTLLECCDAVVVLDGWDASNGTKAEIDLAEELQIPTFYEGDYWFSDELEAYINDTTEEYEKAFAKVDEECIEELKDEY